MSKPFAIDHDAYARFCMPGANGEMRRRPLTEKQKVVYNAVKNNASIGEISSATHLGHQAIKVYIQEIRAKGWDV